jgi:hypothetical protein
MTEMLPDDPRLRLDPGLAEEALQAGHVYQPGGNSPVSGSIPSLAGTTVSMPSS